MAKILDIILNPNSVLRMTAKEIEKKDITSPQMRELAEDMFQTMMEKDGVGLAAPQIGKSIRLVVIHTKEGSLFLFNPKIIKKSILKEWDEEGCLSVPMYFGEVKRHRSVTCSFFDENGEKRKVTAHGLLARVMQHEIDHLDGILFIDKAKNVKKLDEAEVKEED